jgi:hypothetical protein
MNGLAAYIGKQRSGKTYSAMLDIVDDLLPGGGTYYGNIKGIEYDDIARIVEKRHGVEISASQVCPISPSDIGTWYDIVPDGTTIDGYQASIGVFIDEVHLYFNALKRGKDLLKCADRMCQLGKTGIAMRIIAPSYLQIDTQLRYQMQEIWLHKDIRRLPIIRHISGVIPSALLRVEVDTATGRVTGEWQTVYKEQDIFKTYKSFGLQNESIRDKVTKTKLLKNKKALQKLWLSRAALLAFTSIGLIGCYDSKVREYEKKLEKLVERGISPASNLASTSLFMVARGMDGAGEFVLLSDKSELRVGSCDSFGRLCVRINEEGAYVADGSVLTLYRRSPPAVAPTSGQTNTVVKAGAA